MSTKILNYLDNYFHQIRNMIELTVIINKDNSERVLITLLDSFIIKRDRRKEFEVLPNYDYILLELFINENPVKTINLALRKLKEKVVPGDNYTSEDVERVCEICEANLTTEYIFNHLIRKMAISLNTNRLMEIDNEFDDLSFKTYCLFDYDFNYLKAWLVSKYSIVEIKEAVRIQFNHYQN